MRPMISGGLLKRCKEGSPLEYWGHRQVRVFPDSTVEYFKSFYDAAKSPSRATIKQISVIDDELLVLHCKGHLRLCFKRDDSVSGPDIDEWHQTLTSMLFLTQNVPTLPPQESPTVCQRMAGRCMTGSSQGGAAHRDAMHRMQAQLQVALCCEH